MPTNKQIFLNWLAGKNIPSIEIDHALAASNKLKFNNHASNADDKGFLTAEKLDSSFKTILKSS